MSLLRSMSLFPFYLVLKLKSRNMIYFSSSNVSIMRTFFIFFFLRLQWSLCVIVCHIALMSLFEDGTRSIIIDIEMTTMDVTTWNSLVDAENMTNHAWIHIRRHQNQGIYLQIFLLLLTLRVTHKVKQNFLKPFITWWDLQSLMIVHRLICKSYYG